MIQVFVILLYIGGGLTVLSALTRVWSSPIYYVTLAMGLGYLFLARKVQVGRRWARIVMLVLCAVGVVRGLTVFGFGGGAVDAVETIVWPAVYAVLLSTKDAKVWCQR